MRAAWLAVTALLLTALSLYLAREIATNKAEIDKILRDYHIPTLNARGELIQ